MADDQAPAGSSVTKERDLSLPISVGLFLVLAAGIWALPRTSDPCAQGMLSECTAQSFATWQAERSPAALQQLEQSCEWYKPACRRLYDVAQTMEADAGDPATIDRYLGLACAAEQFDACVEHGHFKLKQGPDQHTAAAEIFKAACVQRHAPACDALAQLNSPQGD